MGIFTRKTGLGKLLQVFSLLLLLALVFIRSDGYSMATEVSPQSKGGIQPSGNSQTARDGDRSFALQPRKETEAPGKSSDTAKTANDDTVSDESPDDHPADSASEAKSLEPVPFIVEEYDAPVTMYTNTRVNIRYGADVSYERIAVASTGMAVTVSGETDTGWYEVLYGDELGFMKKDYLQKVKPGTPFVFAGDSRTVQMSQAIRKSNHSWIAQVGEGYTWFSNTAISEIESKLGEGSHLILNFGVNDLYDADKYIKRINSRLDVWLASGAVVYYAAVTPVGSGPNVTNAQIEAFNDALQDGLDSRIKWIDGYTYLKENGFSSNDGLHYDYDTYRDLYSFYMTQIE